MSALPSSTLLPDRRHLGQGHAQHAQQLCPVERLLEDSADDHSEAPEVDAIDRDMSIERIRALELFERTEPNPSSAKQRLG